MRFDNNNPQFYLQQYAPNSENEFDRVICVNLDLNGPDEIIISRTAVWGYIGNDPFYKIVVYHNITSGN